MKYKNILGNPKDSNISFSEVRLTILGEKNLEKTKYLSHRVTKNIC